MKKQAQTIELEAAEPANLLDEIVVRTSLADIRGSMVQARQRIEDAVNDPHLSPEERDDIITTNMRLINDDGLSFEQKIEHRRYMHLASEERKAALRAEIKRLKARLDYEENSDDFWNNDTIREMEAVKSIRTPLATISVVVMPNNKLVIENEKLLPSIEDAPAFYKQPKPEIDKAAIKAALETGVEIPGAKLEDTKYMKWK